MTDDPQRDELRPTDPVAMPASPPYQPPQSPVYEPPPASMPPSPPYQPPPASMPPSPPYQPPPASVPPQFPPPSVPPAPERQGPSSKGIAVIVATLAVLCALVGYGFGASIARSHSTTSATALPQGTSSASSTDSPSNSSSSTSQALPSPSSGSSQGGNDLSASDVAQKVDPAIVDINVTFTSGRGAGTGMVLTSNGLVLTNNHVIADSTDIQVQSVTTGDTWTAKVVGYDITDDVALLQLQNASGLPTINVGDSDAVKAGESVVALGNALGQGGAPAIAQGSVTQLDQSIDVANEDGSTSTLSGLIETTARLQPGDSGGPLVDTTGSVIGMDAAATTRARGRTTNDSFAIPINTALDVARRIEGGQASTRIHVGERGLLGVQASGGQSATISGVEPGSPADAAGLTSGDTITAIDGNAVNSVNDIVSALDAHHPGDSVSVTWVDASGQRHGANIKLVAGPPA